MVIINISFIILKLLLIRLVSDCYLPLLFIFISLSRRGGRRKISLPVYNPEDDTNDFSDLGIGTSSASGKSSLSEDFDNHSVVVSISVVN